MAKRTYLWCDNCKRSFDFPDAPRGTCPICAAEMREMGWVTAFVRGFMAQELVSTGLPTRHRTLVRLIWTKNGLGEQYYKTLAPPVQYSTFEAQVTDFICAAAAEGWIRFEMPPSPTGATDNDYRMVVDDEERFIAELAALFEA